MVGSSGAAGDPPIIVVPAPAPEDRARLLAGAPDTATVVDAGDVVAAVRALVDARDRARAARVAELELELGDVVDELEDRSARLTELDETRDRLLRWADWCDAQPAEAIGDVAELSEANRAVERASAESRDAGRALEDVLEQQATADAALEDARLEVDAHAAIDLSEAEVRQELERAEQRLTEAGDADATAVARRQIEVLQRTLALRAEPRSGDQQRQQAVEALAQQAAALEERLAEAVEAARQRADGALRGLAQAEQALERLHQRERGRHRRLRDAVAALPAELRPSDEDRPLDQAAEIAAALRTHATADEADRAELSEQVDALTRRRDDLHRSIDDERAGLGSEAAADLVTAIGELIDAAPSAPVVLDDPLDPEEWLLVLDDLAARPPSHDVVIVTGASAVLDWAIDLPPHVGGVRTDALSAKETSSSAPSPTAESLQFPPHPADAQASAPVISIDRLRAFAFRSPSDPGSPDQP